MIGGNPSQGIPNHLDRAHTNTRSDKNVVQTEKRKTRRERGAMPRPLGVLQVRSKEALHATARLRIEIAAENDWAVWRRGADPVIAE